MARMLVSDLQTQYTRLRSSAINADIQTLAAIYYGSALNNSVVYGELDVILKGETVAQRHELQSIADVTAFLQQYSYQTIVLQDKPFAYYRLGETAGSSVYDATLRNGAGVVTGTTGLGASGALAGNTDKAFASNGSNSILLPATVKPDYLTGFSVECWCKPAVTPSGYPRLIANDRPNTNKRGFELMLAPPADGVLGYWNVGQTNNTYDGTSFGSATAVVGSWYHLVAIFGGPTSTNFRVYVNGALAAGGYTTNVVPIAPSPTSIGIGYNPSYGGDSFNGTIDEVALYDYVLSAAQIAQHYNVGIGVF